MLSDLAASGGCLLEPGDSGVNNPLAQFSRSVVDGGRQQAEALASAPSGPPALHAHGVGPSLPPLGAEEAAFLDEYHATRPAEAARMLAKQHAIDLNSIVDVDFFASGCIGT